MIIKNVDKSFSCRFANVRFIVILWDDDADQSYISNMESVIDMMFPYKLIGEEEVALNKAIDFIGMRAQNLVIGNVGMKMHDDLQKIYLGRKSVQELQSYFRKMRTGFNNDYFEYIEKLIIDDYNSR